MSLAAPILLSALLAGEPVSAREVGRDVERILDQERYEFCEADNVLEPFAEDLRWCELAAARAHARCSGYAQVCARGLEGSGDVSLAPGSDGGGQQEQQPGKANRNAYEEQDEFELPDLGVFAKILMWALILGGAIALAYAIAKNLIRDRDEDQPELEPEPDPGESLVAARAAAMRAVETDVQRLLARAEQAAGRGDHEAAIHDVYAALLRRLEGEQLIHVERWKTNGDYLAELRPRPPLRDEVREIVRDVEQVQFGAAPAEQGRYVAIRTKVLAVVGRAALAFAVLTSLSVGGLLGCRLFEDDPDALPSSAKLAGLGTRPGDQRAVGELLLVHDIEAKHRSRSIDQLTGTGGAIVLLDDVTLLDEDWDTLERWVRDEGGTLIIATGEDFPRKLGVDYQVFDPVTALAVASDEYFFANLELVAPPGRVFGVGAGLSDPLLVREPERDAQDQWGFDFDLGSEQAPITVASADARSYVARRDYGEGRLLLFAEPDLWTNAGISVADNAAFLINLLRLHDIGEVEFVDQYTGVGPDDPFESVGNAKLGALFIQILLFLALLYAAVGIPFARLRDPQAERRRAFVEHVGTLGQRYAQARASRYVAALYSAWAIDRLRERLLLRSGGLLPLAQAIAARTGRDEAQVMQLLVDVHELRETGNSQAGGSSSSRAADLELMRRLAKLLDEVR